MPTFDVITPAYNAAHFLPMALDSVIAQTFTDWRILLVDDGSTDNTPEVVKKYQQLLGNKLLYIRQPNGGMSAARNTAIRHASADYLSFLDADDVWLPNRLERALEQFRTKPSVGLVYGFVSRIDHHGRLFDTFDKRHPHGEGRIAPVLYKRTLDVPCPTISVRRACVEEVGNFDESLRGSEDRDLWIRITSRYDAALVPEVVAHYRISPNSVSSDLDRMAGAQRQLIERYRGISGCGWAARRIALNWLHRQRAENLADRGQLGAAMINALKALAYYPLQKQAWVTVGAVCLRFVRPRKRASTLPVR